MKYSKRKPTFNIAYKYVISMFFFTFLVKLSASSEYQVISCDQSYIANPQQQCDLQQANQSLNNKLIIQSNVLLSNKVLAGGRVVISNGKITDVICADYHKSSYQDYNQLSCPNTVLSPGFINPHEHIGHSYVPTKTIKKHYQHRDDWRFNKDRKVIIDWPKEINNLDNLNWIELRHLLSGTTTVASAQPYGNIVKHYDNYFMKTMPFGHDTVKAFGDPLGLKCSLDNTACPTPFISKLKDNIPHVGEGIDSLAKVEIKSYIRNILNNKNTQGLQKSCEFCQNNKFSFVHGVAADHKDLQLMATNNISLIWSLTSNLRLYGKTANIIDFYHLGGNIAISTDWSASGSFNMLEELSAVIKYNQEYLNNFFSDYQLWQMSTINGAKALGIESKTGEIKTNLAADLVLAPYKNNNYHRSILENNPQTILAIWQDGVLQAANSSLVDNNKLNLKNICTQQIALNNYLCLNKDKLDYYQLKMLNQRYLSVL
jgi:hypothetical protein